MNLGTLSMGVRISDVWEIDGGGRLLQVHTYHTTVAQHT